MALTRRLWHMFLQLLLLLSSCIAYAEPVAARDAVSQATDILRTIAPSSRSSASTRQTGLSYYAKELFTQLFLSGPPTSSSDSDVRPASEPLSNAIQLLEQAADQDDPDALYMLAEMNFYGNYSLPRNFPTAFDRYLRLAYLTGNATAQHMVGFMYATGIGGSVEQDQAKALLYYTFAAEGGDIRAEMAVAYRYHAGISTGRNCDEAVHYYKSIADKAMDYIRSGPPGYHMVVKESYRIADEDGGVYGEGASVSSSGMNARHGPAHSDAYTTVDNIIEYLDLLSRKGDLKATFQLAKMHYDGSRGMKRDLRLARQYFLEVARVVWPKKGPRKQDVPSSTEKLASKAAGFLGRMFLRGEGVKQDFELAKTWFTRGVSVGDALSQYSMGIMYLNGFGVMQDAYRAYEYFSPAADQDLASAQVRLGVLFLDQGDTTTALQYFDHAARNGHIEAYYFLAELSYGGIGRDQSCPVAAAYYKIVAEKAEIILAPFKEANEAYANGDMETALLDFLLAAEQGFESAQANVAYILDKALPRFRLRTLGNALPSSSSGTTINLGTLKPPTSLALLHWSRSATQRNIDSLLKMGDYYLFGLGTPHAAPDAEKAASCYQAAAETMHSAQAYWNLGWMYENGVGMGQDFHLAKRFYDLALETNKEAYLPVKLALGKLRVRSAWNRWVGGESVRSIEEEKPQRKTWTEWLHAFLEADAALNREYDYHDGEDPSNLLDDRDDWYSSGGGQAPEDYDDLDFEDGLAESLLIIGAAALLMILIMYRRRRQEERERERLGLPAQQQAQQGGAQDRGLFPEPRAPEFGGWVAGGIGH